MNVSNYWEKLRSDLNPYFFDPEGFERRYNCSFYDYDSIPTEQRQHKVFGVLIVGIYAISVPLYALCAVTMCLTDLRKRSCYQLMILLSIIDIIDLHGNSLVFGVLSYIGVVYCVAPRYLCIHGMVCLSAWFGSTLTTLILNINRCCELKGQGFAQRFFGGRMNIFWVAFVIFYASLVPICIVPPVFDGVNLSLFFNPHMSYYPDNGQIYYSNFHSIHNMAMCVSHTTTYLVFIGLYIHQFRGLDRVINDKRTYIQVILIGFFHFASSFSYTFEQLVPVGFYGGLIATMSYILATALPPFVYLTFNLSIQRALKKIVQNILKIKDKVVAPSGHTTSQVDQTLRIQQD
ncbi:unnamed protein product [Bursaphelenchus xylophilus]|uniref:(pine wood nematode) hypothetical protein n=1 Tax=Bursaphelenchus xylophilus TaxID=6326 RepID=A0A1I7RIE6_BURXY|nr:unnamed protein product [Bursaphelenchus xylophilus]CAG9080861.1 unnamed protein product [Bursaphelenchus xylophilus]